MAFADMNGDEGDDDLRLDNPSELSSEFADMELEELRAKDRKILTDGASNAEYHYLGSAKILGGIGKAFAEALGGMTGGGGGEHFLIAI